MEDDGAPGLYCEDMKPGRTTWAADAALAVALAGLGVTEALVPFSTVTGHGSTVAAATLAATCGLVLVLRRRLPLVTVAAVMLPLGITALILDFPVLFWGGLAPMAVATYSVSRHGRGRQPLWGLLIAVAGLLLFTVGTGMIARFGELFFPSLVLAAAWLTGLIIRRKDSTATASELRARDAEAQSREQTLAAIAEERARIARELHDVVAHSVTAIVVQAGAARDVVDTNPDYARTSLDRIRQTGTEALDEMRRVVTLLRGTSETQPLGPQPGLADLAALVERSQTQSTEIRLAIEGEERSLPLGADLAAYRIVQEALTNVHRHAAATETTVTVSYRDNSLRVEICDNGVGRTAGAPPNGSGHGLVGMRERALMYGGHLETANRPGAGFRVCVTLPLESTATQENGP